MDTKECRLCNKNLPLKEFSIRSDSKKHRSECKICLNKKRKKQKSYGKWHKNNKERLKLYERGYRVVRKYGISLMQYYCMLDLQEHKCAICETTNPKGKGRFHIDHCHVSGKVRALLCSDCNPGLGQFKDNVELLEKAIQYLKLHKNLADGH